MANRKERQPMQTTGDHPLAHQLDPVLRELMAFGLVEKSVDGPEIRWNLTRAAQQRLSALERPVPDSASMYFVGHRCDRCREHAITRRVGERYLCARCQAEQRWDPPDSDRKDLRAGEVVSDKDGSSAMRADERAPA